MITADLLAAGLTPSGTYERKVFAAELEALYKGRFWTDQPTSYTSFGLRYMATGRLLDAQLTQHFPSTMDELGETIIRWAPTLLRSVVDTLAGHTSESVELALIDRNTGERALASNYPVVKYWDRIQESWDILEAMDDAHTAATLHGTSFPWARLLDDELVIDVLHPYAVDLDAHKRRPKWVKRAQSITVPMVGNGYVPLHDAYERAHYKLDEKGAWTAQIIDMAGKPTGEALPEAPRGQNLLGRHPIVAWHSQSTDGPFAEPDYALYYDQLAIALFAIEVGLAIQFGTFGKWTISGDVKGRDDSRDLIQQVTADGTARDTGAPKRRVIPAGPHGVIEFEGEGKVDYVQPVADAIRAIDAMVQVMQVSAMVRGISPRRFDLQKEGSNVTGKARLVQEMPLALEHERRERRLKRNTRHLLEAVRPVHNLLHRRGDVLHIPEELGFKAHFEALPNPAMDLAIAQGLHTQYEDGSRSVVRDVAAREGLTFGEAQRRVKARRQEIIDYRSALAESTAAAAADA